MESDRLGQAAMRRHHIGVKTRSLRFRGDLYVFRYNAGHYDVFLHNDRVMSLTTRNILEAIQMFKQRTE